MKRHLLLTLLTLMAGFGVMKADNININIDNAANVRVTVDNGATVINLVDGMNRITEYSSENNPLMIEPVAGAAIDKVTKNNSTVLTPNYIGVYTMGIEAMMLDIETSGSAEADIPEETMVWFQVNGPAGSVELTCDGAPVAISSDTFAYSPVKSLVPTIIAPAEGYLITNVEGDRANITKNDDGTWSYLPAQYDTMLFVNIYSEQKPVEGTAFTVECNYMPDLYLVGGRLIVTETETQEEYVDLFVKEDGSCVLPTGFEYINFFPEDGAEVTSLMRNGENVPLSAWVGYYRSNVEEGDHFTVTVQGPEQEVLFYSENFRNGVGLEAFTVKANGREIELSGEQQYATLHRGDQMTVSGKGLNTCTSVMCGMSYMTEPPFEFNLGPNTIVSIGGTAVNGVQIDVKGAECIEVKQLNGFGEVLALVDGENKFEVDDIQNNLSIAALDGCQILSVVVNQQTVQPANNGTYDIKVSNGMLIEVNARKIPEFIPITVMVCDMNADNAVSDELASHVSLTLDGEPVDLTAGMTTLNVKYLATVEASAKDFGFVLEGVDCGNNYLREGENSWSFIAEEPCMLTLEMREIIAPEGSVLVEFKTNDTWHVSFLAYDANLERIPDSGKFNPSQPGVVKIGDYVGVYKASYDLKFASITVDGEPIKIDAPEDQDPFQEYFIKIEKECVIEAKLFDPNEGMAQIICWNTDIDPFGMHGAQLFVKDKEGKLVDRMYAYPGEVVEFVVPYVAPGYLLTEIAGQTPASPTMKDPANFKFTVPDEIINPESGAPVLFIWKPVIEVDQANPPVVLEFYPTYIQSEVAAGKEVVGYLVGIEPYFNGEEMAYHETTCMMANVGAEVEIRSYERDDYKLVRIFDQNEQTVTSPYTVKLEDAYVFLGYNKINFGAEYEKRGEGGLSEVYGNEGTLHYDAANEIVSASGEIRVVDMTGTVVASGEGAVSVARLSAGMYVAVNGNATLKFIKK